MNSSLRNCFGATHGSIPSEGQKIVLSKMIWWRKQYLLRTECRTTYWYEAIHRSKLIWNHLSMQEVNGSSFHSGTIQIFFHANDFISCCGEKKLSSNWSNFVIMLAHRTKYSNRRVRFSSQSELLLWLHFSLYLFCH